MLKSDKISNDVHGQRWEFNKWSMNLLFYVLSEGLPHRCCYLHLQLYTSCSWSMFRCFQRYTILHLPHSSWKHTLLNKDNHRFTISSFNKDLFGTNRKIQEQQIVNAWDRFESRSREINWLEADYVLQRN